MYSTSFKWYCEKGHEFNNPQMVEGSDSVITATTEAGVSVVFRSMLTDEPSDLRGAVEKAQEAAEPPNPGHIAPHQVDMGVTT